MFGLSDVARDVTQDYFNKQTTIKLGSLIRQKKNSMAKNQKTEEVLNSGIRDRIREMRRMKGFELKMHPNNWRTHGEVQGKAMDGILNQVGIADALLAFPADGLGPNGNFAELMLFDGHARTERDLNQEWPVLVTDLTRAEADLMLLTIDPLAAMAGIESAALSTLLKEVQNDDAGLAAMLDGLQAQAVEWRLEEMSEVQPDIEAQTEIKIESGDDAEFRTLHVPLTVGQERVFREAMKVGKAKFTTQTTGETLSAILGEWING